MEKYTCVENEAVSLAGNGMIKILGRHTEEDGKLLFDWSGSGISFNFCGAGFILSLGEYKADVPAYVKVTVDGGAGRRFAICDGREKIIIEGLPEKRHRAEIIKITEGAAKLAFETVSLLGSEAAFQLPPRSRRRKLEFIGDSITAGYGVLGRRSDPSYATYQQDVTRSYAGLTVQATGAEGRYICISGKGIVCNCEGNREDVKAGEYYERQTYGGGICRDGWTPDAVIVNIGTNDSGGPAGKEEFARAAEELICGIRARYKDAQIIWMYGMMNDYYAETLSDLLRRIAAKDGKVHYLHVAAINEAETGANGHPNMRGQARASALLNKKLASVLGWRGAGSAGE